MDASAAPATPPPMTAAKPLWRTFLTFLVPMMLANILQSLSGTLNSVFLGNMLGVNALAAATVFFPVMFFFIAFIIGLSSGATILIGQAFGRGDLDRVRAIAGTALAVTVVAGVVVAVLGGLLAGPLMTGLGAPDDIRADAIIYARIMLISMPVLFVFLFATSVLRGVGDTVTPLWTLAFSTLIGLIATPAFIVGYLGLPQLGVASAAVASLVSLVGALAWLSAHLHQKKHPLAPNAALRAHMRLDWKMLGLILRLGVPMGVQMVIMAVAELVLLGLVNGYGSKATAAYGAINQVLAYVQFPAMSIGISASILGAQAIGAKRVHMLWPITRTGLLMNLAITGVGVVLVYLFSRSVVAMFITDPEVVELTQHLLHIVLWSTLAFGCAVVFSGVMRSSGAVLAPMALAILAIVAVEVPVAVIASRQIGMEGIWWGYPACFVAMMIFQGAWYTFVWRRRSIKALV